MRGRVWFWKDGRPLATAGDHPGSVQLLGNVGRQYGTADGGGLSKATNTPTNGMELRLGQSAVTPHFGDIQEKAKRQKTAVFQKSVNPLVFTKRKYGLSVSSNKDL